MNFQHHAGKLEVLLLVCSVLMCLLLDCCVFGLQDKWQTMFVRLNKLARHYTKRVIALSRSTPGVSGCQLY